MTTTQSTPRQVSAPSPGRRAGYAAAIVVNAALLFVVNNLLEWAVAPFITADFASVLGLINLSLGATIVVNAGYLVYDARWFTSLTQVGLLGISMAATLRLYRVFPFDFSSYQIDWATMARAVLILAMVGVAIAIVVEIVKLVAAVTRR